MLATLLSRLQQEALKKQGFCSTEVTISPAKAALNGILYAAPFLIFLTGVYQISLSRRAAPDIGNLHPFFFPAMVLSAGAILHEGFHGIGWAVFAKAGWNSIIVHFRGIKPTCSCCLVLTKQDYLTGILTPAAVLCSFHFLLLILCPGTVFLLTTAIHFLLAGADLAAAATILKSDYFYLSGHPTKIGFIGYTAGSETEEDGRK